MYIQLPINYNESNPIKRKAAREQYIKLQKGLCSYCRNPLVEQPPAKVLKLSVNIKLFPENFFKYPIHLHHDHDTGLTKGAIHSYCNAILWQYHYE